jgi:DNA-binding NarL/FixJ family response regulator
VSPPRPTVGEDSYIYDAMRAGASGFLLKDSERRHLLHAVRVVAGGDELLDPAITRRLIEGLVRRPPRVEGTPVVASILHKLDLRDRVQIVIRAYEAGLVWPGES